MYSVLLQSLKMFRSSSSLGSTMLAWLASSMSESVMSWKGFGRLDSSNTERCACSCSNPASQGWPFLKQ